MAKGKKGPPNKTEAIRLVLKLQPKVEAKLKQIVGRHKLYALLGAMERGGEIGTVGYGEHRRYVRITGRV